MEPLPLEIWTQIFKMLGKSEWLVLSRTCTAGRILAQSRLYEQVFLRSNGAVPEASVKCNTFMRSIIERPALARLVRQLKLLSMVTLGKYTAHQALRRLDSFSNLRLLRLTHFFIDANLCDSIRRLPNLDHLEFDDCSIDRSLEVEKYSQKTWTNNASKLAINSPRSRHGWTAVSIPSLTCLELRSHSVEQGAEYRFTDLMASSRHNLVRLHVQGIVPSNLIAFLLCQPHLRQLSLGSIYSQPSLLDLPSVAIPLLERFSGPSEYAETFVKDRPVHTAVIDMQDEPDICALRSLRLASVPVINLEVDGWSLEFEALQHAPTTLHHFGWRQEHNFPRVMSWMQVFSQFPDLRSISGVHPGNQKERKALVLAACGACGVLQEFEFEIIGEEYGYETWRRCKDGTWTFEQSS